MRPLQGLLPLHEHGSDNIDVLGGDLGYRRPVVAEEGFHPSISQTVGGSPHISAEYDSGAAGSKRASDGPIPSVMGQSPPRRRYAGVKASPKSLRSIRLSAGEKSAARFPSYAERPCGFAGAFCGMGLPSILVNLDSFWFSVFLELLNQQPVYSLD